MTHIESVLRAVVTQAIRASHLAEKPAICSHKIQEVTPVFVWQVCLPRGRKTLSALRLVASLEDFPDVPQMRKAPRRPPDLPTVRCSSGEVASCAG